MGSQARPQHFDHRRNLGLPSCGVTASAPAYGLGQVSAEGYPMRKPWADLRFLGGGELHQRAHAKSRSSRGQAVSVFGAVGNDR
jgi:hypothetical protein